MNDNDHIAQPGSAPTKPRRCPVCGKPAREADRPFCSKRCGDIDLGRWLKGSYVIPGAEKDESEDQPSERRDLAN